MGSVGLHRLAIFPIHLPFSKQPPPPSSSSPVLYVCYGLHPVVKSELFLRSEKGTEESQFVGTRLWFLLEEPSPPLHSFMGLKEVEAVFSPVQPGMGLRLVLGTVTI